jgi:type IV pilus assembly protein PilY1
LREDGNGNQVLDGYDVDPVIKFFYDDDKDTYSTVNDGRTKFVRLTSSDPNNFDEATASVSVHDLADLKSVWNAQSQLWIENMDTDTQRAYTTAAGASSQRYIFTWIDKNHNGKVDSGEQVDFVPDSFNSDPTAAGSYRFLNTDNYDHAAAIVDWVRGKEEPGMRSRTVEVSGTKRVMRLGDIINSTPLVVGTPSEAYDLLYNDDSYGKFRANYRDRRQMVYVGANDGMLHAFNGGFYDAQGHKLSKVGPGTTPATAHEYGSEVWAYVPGDLLPHLRWLTDPSYSHVFYMDGSPIAVDAKVFTADSTHVEGWGTLLIAPFRLGGGPISVATSSDADDPGTQNSYSVYVVMDVTDPEQPPKLLAEIPLATTSEDGKTVTDGDITQVKATFALPIPAVAPMRDAVSGSPNKWFLFTGSGPTDNGGTGTFGGKVTSNTPLAINAYDLADVVAGNITPVKTFDFEDVGSTGKGADSFAGDLIASDFNLDFKSEALYFGSTKGSTAPFTGSFWKLDLGQSDDPSTWTAKLMYDAGSPITARPTMGRNNRGAPMVFFGSGRAFADVDKSDGTQQYLWGMVDTSLLPTADSQYKALPVSSDDLVDVSGVKVYDDASVTGAGDADTFQKLFDQFDDADSIGWSLKLQTTTGQPSERMVSSQTLLGGVLLSTTYIPSLETCTGVGTSRLYGLNYKTGTADPSNPFFGSSDGGSGKKLLNNSTDLGPGLPAQPSLHIGEGSGQRKVTACVQTSTGAILCKDITTLKSVLSGEVSWREPVDQ